MSAASNVQNIIDMRPLTPMQEGILYDSIISPGDVYTVQIGLRIRGKLNPLCSQRAFMKLIERHETLRTNFSYESTEEPVQVIFRNRLTEFVLVVEEKITVQDDLASAIERHLLNERGRKFDLRRDPLIRMRLLRHAIDNWTMLITYHHIVMDGWCIPIFLGELSRLYQSEVTGMASGLQPAVSLKGYSMWLDQTKLQGARGFWETYLRGFKPYDQISAKLGFEKFATMDIVHLDSSLCDTTSQSLKMVANELCVTPYLLCRTVWGALLGGIVDSEEVIFGTVVSGRATDIPGMESMLGLFINTIPVRLATKSDEQFCDVVRRSQIEFVKCKEHGVISLAELQRKTGSGQPLFDHLVVFEDFPKLPRASVLGSDDLSVVDVISWERNSFELTISFCTSERFEFKVSYNSGRFSAEVIEQLVECFKSAAEAVANNRMSTMGELRALSARIRRSSGTSQISLEGSKASRMPETSKIKMPPGDVENGKIENELLDIWRDLLENSQLELDDDFFGNGGHSLKAIRAVMRAKRIFQVKLNVNDVFENPTARKFAHKIKTAVDVAELVEIRPAGNRDYYPLSSAQRRLYFLQELDAKATSYNVAVGYRIAGKVDPVRVEHAINSLIEHHHSLRTSFDSIDGYPVQRISEVIRFKLEYEENSEFDYQETVDGFLKPFTLSRAPLFRAKLIRRSELESLLLMDLHHIITDGRSFEILTRDFLSTYSGKTLNPYKLRYVDYAVNEAESKFAEKERREIEFWKRKLNGASFEHFLPVDMESNDRGPSNCGVRRLLIDHTATTALRDTARAHNCTIFTVLVAAFQTLGACLSGTEDITIGTDVENRNSECLDDIVGFFVNQLVIRTNLAGNPTIGEIVRRVKNEIVEAFLHQELPFDILVREVKAKRDVDWQPLFKAKLVLQNRSFAVAIPGGGISFVESFTPKNGGSKVDFMITLSETSDSLFGIVDFNQDLFSKKNIDRICDSYMTVLRLMCEPEDRKLGEINDLLEGKERSRLNARARSLAESRLGKLQEVISPSER